MCKRFFHLELMYCLQDHPEIMPCCSKNAAKSLLIHCQKLPAALSATFLFIAVGNLKLVAKGTQSFTMLQDFLENEQLTMKKSSTLVYIQLF